MGSGESEALVQLGRAWGCGDGLGTGCWVSLGGEQWKKRSLAQPRAGVGASVPAGHRLPRALPESAARLGSPTPHTRQNRIPPFSSTLGSSGIFPALSLGTPPTHCFPLSWPKAQLDPVVLDVPVTLDTPP